MSENCCAIRLSSLGLMAWQTPQNKISKAGAAFSSSSCSAVVMCCIAAKLVPFWATSSGQACGLYWFGSASLQEKNMLAIPIFVLFLAALASLAQAEAPPLGNAARGELLYATHCIACHSDQVHWRDKKIATDWPNLQSEVERWQGLSGLRWNPQDIADVARYLNTAYYHYPAGLLGRTTGNGGKPARIAGP
jgi:mono/diheme cytochrome c family protein